ncbi:molybdopterin converting factor, subunit 1 [Thioalkalivibrio nitratireducens DSM 14787]|uniref:Molybdopterin synthase sulfur carrier subunit n=1 Tax=Thioalkalivibrio nitratireducens (strain DSM 14787 / UNIQEM 213 / ALEN2) TaxID=1255043 RepID=L0E1Q4_THIND|nr:MoaD/ThiS family protein [Thioalkalivibrio nitratireducens]AGA35223.1 molybdopterin converting factor, subunit 1 [Thioalkalivibrio nitratireducens DSM 14787]
MTITVHYFARLREDVGRASDEVPSDGITTVAELWQHLHRAPPPPRLMAAVNQAHARLDSAVADGDEVAFFPPVTGG